MPLLEDTALRLDELLFSVGELQRTGEEVPESVTKEMDEVLAALVKRSDAFGYVMLELAKKAEACKDTAGRLRERAKRFEGQRAWLEQRIALVMARLGMKKLEGPEVTLTRIAGRESVSVDDIALIPAVMTKASFFVHVPATVAAAMHDAVEDIAPNFSASVADIVTVPDKEALAIALASGEVPGASIAVGLPRVRVYISRKRGEPDGDET